MWEATTTPVLHALSVPRLPQEERKRGNRFLIPFRKNPGTTMRRAHTTMRCRRRWCGSSAQGFGYTIAYTWSKTLDEGGDGYFGMEGGVQEHPYNPKGSRGPASFDIPQILTANAIYQLPFGTGRRFATGNRFADYVIGNWQVNGIFSARSGQHLNITAAGDIANTGNAGTYERADLLGDPFHTGPIAGN